MKILWSVPIKAGKSMSHFIDRIFSLLIMLNLGTMERKALALTIRSLSARMIATLASPFRDMRFMVPVRRIL